MAGKVLGFRFAAVPLAVLDALEEGELSATAVLAFTVLSRYANTERQAYPSKAAIARQMGGVSQRTALRALQELEEGDWVRKEPSFTSVGTQTANLYYLYPFEPSKSERGRVTPMTPRGDKNVTGEGDTHDTPKELDPSNTTRTSDLDIAPAAPEMNGRARDPIFEAIAEACEMDWHHLTPTARSQLGRAVKEIKEAGDATPEEIRWRASVYHQRLPDCPLTPPAFMKWWPTCSERPLTQTDRNLMEILEDRRRERVRGSKDRESNVLDVPHWEDDDGDPDDLDRESYAP